MNLIDVREPAEYAEANIGGLLLPLGRVQSMDIAEIEHLKEEEVILQCRSGKRSATAALMLEQFGFTNTVNLTGGILAWHEKFGK